MHTRICIRNGESTPEKNKNGKSGFGFTPVKVHSTPKVATAAN